MISRVQHFTLLSIISSLSLIFGLTTCDSSFSENDSSFSNTKDNNRVPSQKAKDYWYDGSAEISSYSLSQARYGELREGKAVLIYVTEPFSKKYNTKADENRSDNIPVLKLNKTKNFITGIYPYTMMNSTFFPFEGESTSLKIATSMHEWCGISHLEMKNDGKLNFNLNSYFEGESFENKKIRKDILEDDLWSLIRLNPELLPTGKNMVIPSLFYSRLSHQEIKAYEANITLTKDSDSNNQYKIEYPKTGRSMTITFGEKFPHKILGWEEITNRGYGQNKKQLITKAQIINTIKSDYWNKKSIKDESLRTELGL